MKAAIVKVLGSWAPRCGGAVTWQFWDAALKAGPEGLRRALLRALNAGLEENGEMRVQVERLPCTLWL